MYVQLFMCSNVRKLTYYRSKRKTVVFQFSEFVQFSELCKKISELWKSLKYGVSSAIDELLRTFFFCHDALELIRLKWKTFRFQILWHQNLANYVFVTGYVLKCVYFHLLSLKRRKRDFWFSEFVFFSELCKKSDFTRISKTCCIKCYRRAEANGVATMML